MRKKALGIIGGVVLVAALGTASFFLLRNTPEEDSSSVSSSDSSEESISLTSEDPNDVTSIDITNGSGSFAVVRTAEGTGTGDDNIGQSKQISQFLPDIFILYITFCIDKTFVQFALAAQMDYLKILQKFRKECYL